MKSTRNSWQKRIRHAQTVLLFVAIFAAGFAFGNQTPTSEAQGRIAISDTEEAFSPFWEAYDIIQNRYIEDVDINILVNGAITGMVDSLGDENSVYHDPEAYPLISDVSGNYEGIGVQIRFNEETTEVEVVTVFAGSPAADAGLLAGDIFVEVEGENVIGLNTSELANLVRGPAGSSVNITMRRGDELINFDIVRARVEIPNIEYEILEDSNIGYIKLYEFNAQARRQLDEALEGVDVHNRSGLILDLRGNPGGLLSTAIDVGSAFIEDGPIIYEVFGDGREDVFAANGNYANIEVPIVVLVNEGSASASELIAGALQDLDVATIIGEVSFGKGTVQTIVPLSNGGGVRITIARFLTPSRNWVHKQGVQPDILVEWNPAEESEDIQLQAAIDFLLGEAE